jgi:hypothetical protein
LHRQENTIAKGARLALACPPLSNIFAADIATPEGTGRITKTRNCNALHRHNAQHILTYGANRFCLNANPALTSRLRPLTPCCL